MLDDMSHGVIGAAPYENDSEIHDAYSNAVMGAVDKAGPAVVHVSITKRQGAGGMGSGLVLASDGLF